ncbi:hypothetical protein [Mucilaginibacter antarcticus]|uniref:hypothetical protein n=1 Tax=Mucilaginibacter antarcticus TaxID=1855725 RepID=UPI00362B9F9E
MHALNPLASFIEVKTYYEPNKALVTVAKLSLDKEGNVIETKSYDTRGKLEYHHKYQYDKDNNCTEDVEVSQVTLKEDKSVFTYDKGNLIKQVVYLDFGETKTMVTYTYIYPKFDNKHNWLIRKMYYNGRLSQIYDRTIIYRK